MVSHQFTHEVPRLEVGSVLPLITTSEDRVEVEVEINSDVRLLSLTSTPAPRRGGRHWWWLCPRCGHRRAHLYLVGEVICRVCARLKYGSTYRI